MQTFRATLVPCALMPTANAARDQNKTARTNQSSLRQRDFGWRSAWPRFENSGGDRIWWLSGIAPADQNGAVEASVYLITWPRSSLRPMTLTKQILKTLRDQLRRQRFDLCGTTLCLRIFEFFRNLGMWLKDLIKTSDAEMLRELPTGRRIREHQFNCRWIFMTAVANHRISALGVVLDLHPWEQPSGYPHIIMIL